VIAQTPTSYSTEDRGRAWLITGGAGFIGSHLVDALLARGARVVGLDNLSTGRLENIAPHRDNPRFRFVQATIFDEAALDELTAEADVIVHLAAAVGVELIVERPAQAIETNVLGTEAVLRAALRHRRPVLLASTSEVYGKGSQIPFREDDDVVLGPTCRSRWGYAAGKMLDEFLGLAYGQEYGLPVTPFRLFNTAGPRQSGRYGMVIPRFVGQALRAKPITIFGDGNQSRCFCDVLDAVQAIIGLAEHPEAPGKVFNIGSTEEVTIRELAERVKAIAGSSSDIRFVPYAEAYAPGFEDMRRRVPSVERIGDLIGWRPKTSLDQLLARTIEHARAQDAAPSEV
jgi:UDP-glucose 4-epimerase